MHPTRAPFGDPVARQHTVLIVSGTGTNAWHPYGFLRRFSLQELRELKAVFGISGGSCTYYARIMEALGLFSDERIALFDGIWRRHLNRKGLPGKIISPITGQPLFFTQDLHRAMDELFGRATDIQFKDPAFSNFHCVLHRLDLDDLFIADAASTPDLSVAYVSASGGFPRKVGKLNLCAGAPGEYRHFSDHDFAPLSVKSKFRTLLQSSYPDCHLVYLNQRKSGSKENLHWIKTGEEQFPLLGQLMDAFCMAVGIPNGRHYATAIRNRNKWSSWPLDEATRKQPVSPGWQDNRIRR